MALLCWFSSLERKWLEEAFVGESHIAAGVVCCLAFAEGRQEHRRVRTAIHDFLLGEAVGDSQEEGFSDVVLKEIVDDVSVTSESSGDGVGHC